MAKVLITRRLTTFAVLALAACLFPALLILSAYYLQKYPAKVSEFLAFIKGVEYLGADDVVFQKKSYDCGAAALKMILDHYQIPSTLEEV